MEAPIRTTCLLGGLFKEKLGGCWKATEETNKLLIDLKILKKSRQTKKKHLTEIYKNLYYPTLSENGMLKYLPNFETRDEIHNQCNEEMVGSDKKFDNFQDCLWR